MNFRNILANQVNKLFSTFDVKVLNFFRLFVAGFTMKADLPCQYGGLLRKKSLQLQQRELPLKNLTCLHQTLHRRNIMKKNLPQNHGLMCERVEAEIIPQYLRISLFYLCLHQSTFIPLLFPGKKLSLPFQIPPSPPASLLPNLETNPAVHRLK